MEINILTIMVTIIYSLKINNAENKIINTKHDYFTTNNDSGDSGSLKLTYQQT